MNFNYHLLDIFTSSTAYLDVLKRASHLDGISLETELATAWVRVLTVEEILKRIDNRFRLLVGKRIALPCQHTFRTLISRCEMGAKMRNNDRVEYEY